MLRNGGCFTPEWVAGIGPESWPEWSGKRIRVHSVFKIRTFVSDSRMFILSKYMRQESYFVPYHNKSTNLGQHNYTAFRDSVRPSCAAQLCKKTSQDLVYGAEWRIVCKVLFYLADDLFGV